MKTKITLCGLALSALVLTACSKPADKVDPPADSTTATATTTQNQPASLPATANDLNWVGDYKGVLPCADCEGIETELELKANNTYELSEEYLGKQSNEFKAKGTFTFDADQNNVITLDNQGQNRKFFIADQYVELRDMQTGKALDTQLNYKLMKEM
jgi:uncharacterized lipoprotein NlpE involved in copper resistance